MRSLIIVLLAVGASAVLAGRTPATGEARGRHHVHDWYQTSCYQCHLSVDFSFMHPRAIVDYIGAMITSRPLTTDN